MKLLNVIFINLLITIAEILSADERCALQNVHGEAIHIAHPTDCHKFYKCDQSHNLQEEICPSNLEYNPHLKVCVYNNSGFCMINSTKTVQSVYNCSSFEDGFKIPNYDDNCRSYVECSNGISKIEICENGQVYDSLKGDCITKNGNFKCEKMQKSLFQISNVLKSDNITFYPNFDNQCRSYIQCNFNKCTEKFCENNKLFNAATNICEENTKVVCSQVHRVKRNSDERIKCLRKNINQKCVNGQYEPDDCSCRNFYLCVSGTWRLQTCAPDKYFNKKDNFCVPNDGSCEEECQHGEYKENENNCAQFLVCVYGKWRLQTCSLYQYFDKTVNYCVPDTNNICPDTKTTTKPNCNHGEYKENSDDCTAFYLCVSGIWRFQKCKKDQYFNKELNYCVPEDGTCRPTTQPTSPTPPTKPPVCVHGEYKEDVEDCTRFYLCVNGQSWRRQICNKDQYFNPKLNYCVPEDGTCRPTTQPTSPTPPTKPPVCIHGEYKEDVEDCQRFYLCVNGQSWRRQICNKDQYFNPKLNYCVPEDGTCRPTTQPTSPTPPTKPPVCIHGEYKEDVEDCQRFYLCVNGQSWRRQICNKDQYFNPKLNYCVPEDGTCRPTTQPTSPTPPTKPPVCIHGEYKEDVEDCQRFYLCVNGQLWRRQICNKDQYFNPKLNYCVPEDGTCRPTTQPTSPTPPTKPPVCIHGEYKEDVEDCQRFYLCVNGQLWRRQICNKDQYFNPKLNYCVPEDGTCRPTTQPTSPTPPTKPPVCIHGEYKEDLEDCQRFYLCVNGQLWRRQICNKDQYFNPKLNYCVPEDGTCRPTTQPTSPTPPTKPPVCIHGEYKEDIEDCQRFYLCVNGQLWRRQICNKDQYFNPKLNYCVPEDGTCRPTTQPTSPTPPTKPPICVHGEYKEDVEDCQRFYLCVLGQWRRQNCNKDQYFNPKLNYCIPEDGTCRPTTQPTSPTPPTKPPICVHGEYKEDVEDCQRFYLCVLGQWRRQHCNKDQYFNPKLNYCIPEDGTCRPTTHPTSPTLPTKPPICVHGEYKQDVADCQKFYLCVIGQWRSQNCNKDQYFNPKLNYCVPEDGTCRPTTVTTPPTTPKPQCIHGQYRAHRECTHFEICVLGFWRLQSCSPDQFFDKDKNYCVPEDGTCKPTRPTTHSTPSPTTPTTKRTTPTTSECITGEYRAVANCIQFELCVLGYWRLHSCGNNKYFNRKKNYCVPEDGSCRPTTPTTEKTTPTTPKTTPSTTPKPECIHGEYKHHHDCTRFWLCVSDHWREQSCPDNQYFDEYKNYCVPEDGTCRSTTPKTTEKTTPTTPKTTPSTTPKPECIHGEFKPHHDCTRFWLCVSDHWREQSCPDNQYFDEYKNYCVPEDGTCRSTTPKTTEKTTPTTPKTTPSTTPKPECIHGEYKHHHDCTRFWLCVSDHWREQSCPDNQYFDEYKNYCVPEDGTCRSTTPKTTEKTTPTTPKTTPSTTPKPECIHGEFKPHHDCTRFWLCVSDHWREQSCPDNQYFDEYKNYCVPEDGTCRSTTPKTTEKTTPTTPKTTPSTTPKPECIHGEFKPHHDCTRFWLCVSDHWREQSCPDNQYFDEYKNYCVPEDGTCRSTTPKTTEKTTPTTPKTTPSTTPKPECIHGEYKHHHDCTRFWLCVSDHWREQSCPNNQYFDEYKNYCVPEDGTCRSTTPKTTEKTTPTTPKTTPSTTPKPECIHGEFKPHHDCTRFWLCVSDHWREQSCPDNQYFDEYKNYCVPEDGTCRSTTPKTTEKTTPTTPKTTPSTTPKPECIHGEYKHHHDCTRFWLCVSDHWREQSCPDNQYFDEYKNYCVPEDGTCRSTTPKTTEKTTPTTPKTTPSTTPKPECIHGEFKPHHDCTRFWLCVSDHWREQSCPDNQYFDEYKNYCVPEDGTCRSTTPKTTEKTTPTTPKTTPSTTPKPECIHGEFKPHHDCTRFWLCVSDHWREQSCPDNQYFDEYKNYCVPEDGTCRSTTPKTTEKTTPTTPKTTPSTTPKPECIHGEFKPHHDCTRFWLCVSDHWREQSCPDNQYFDKYKNYCVPEDGSCRPTTPTTTEKTTPTTPPTTTSTTPIPECPHGEFKEHHDCTRFWLCVSGHWREQSCPNNQYFDKYKNYCVPEDGSCRPTTPTTTTEKTTPTTPTTTTKRTTPTTTTKRTTPTSTSTTEKPECPHGEFKEHHDCTRFWLCVSGHWREQSCPNNQYFDKYKNYCVPEDGSCRPTTPTTTTEKTTPTTPTTTTKRTTPTTTTKRTTPTTTSTTEKPECPHGEFKEHHDCTRFWLCVSGHWREQSCPNNQYFDKYKNYCVPEDGSCRPTTPTTTTEKTTPTTPTTTTKRTTPTTTTKRTTPTSTSTTEKPECPHGEFKEHHDCTRFWLCVSGHWREQSCPNNQYFDKYKNYCVPEDGSCRPTTPTTTTEKTTPTTPTTTTKRTTPTTTTKRTTPTTTSTTEKPECPHGEFKEHHDCTRFWLCVSGHWREQSCPNNQYFDKYKNYCVPEDGSCRPTTPTTTTEKTTPTTPTTTTKRTTPTTTTKRTTPTTTSTTEKPECPHGEFKEHHDCTRFWLCVSGHWREQSCPNNQYFDKYKNYCVPEDGSCRPTTPTTTTEKTTPTTPTTTTKRTTPTTTTKRTTPTSTSTTEKPECPHGEFKEHHDCTRFWLCVSGHWREQSCPNNQYFDKYKNYCVPEDGSCRPTTPTITTEKTTPTTPTTTTKRTTPTTTTKRTTPTTTSTTEKPECPHGEFKEHHDCTRFWLCVSGHWREQSCPNNQYFDKYKNYCVPEDGSCRPTTPTTTTEKTTPTTPTTTTKRTTPTTTTKRTTPTTTSTTEIPECPHGEFKEHHDCTRFWLCVSGHWREQSCPNNQYFDKYKNYCVPEDGSCRPTTPTTTTEKTTPTTPTTTTKRTTPTTTTKRTTPTSTSTTEKPECPHGEFKEHHDCTRFWLCVSGHWREQSCPNNQYFDKYKNYCVPEDGSCRPTTPTTTTEKTTPTTPTTTTKRTTPTTTTKRTTPTTTSTTEKPECPHGEFKEHHDCTRFWLCVSGHWREQSCPNNQYFDKYKNYCVPEDGSCRPTTPTTTTEKTTPTTPTTTTKRTTPTTTTKRTTPTSTSTTEKPECPHGEFKEHHDCTRFWLCVSGHWREQSCPNNQYFDKYKNYCVPEDGSCRPTTPTTTTEKTTPTTPITTTKRTTPTTTTKRTTPTTTSTTEKPECPHGEFKEHHDCTRFWLCVSGHWREQSCPNNQYFDKYKNYCVPEDGSCRPTTPTTTTKKTTPTTPTTTTKRTTPSTTTKRTTPTTTSTTEIPECPHGEFKEHHDCTRFWLCVSGHWREQSCPNNQYFDKYKNYCVPEDGSCRPTTPTTTTERTTPTTPTTTTERTTPTTPTTTTKRTTPTSTSTTEKPECPHGEFKEHHDCTRFWLCVSGHWREQSCPNNQYFDKYKNYCVPEDGSCRPTTPTTTTEKTTPTTPTTTTKRTTPTTTTKRTTPSTTSTTEIPECPHGEFKEHHDCTRFWLCVSGHWREQSCPNNQYFDKYKNYCVPEDGSCRPTTPRTTTKKTTPTTPTTTTKRTTPTTTTKRTTPTTTSTTEIPECPHGEFKEHHDCTRFWLCVSGHWREQSCPNNQYFDKYKNYCVPEDGSCRPTTPTTTTKKTTPTIPTTTTKRTTPTTTTKRTTPTTTSTTEIPECPHGEFKEHHDCTRFWLCVSGHWREQSCPNNQYFDKYKNYCVPEDGSCRPTTPTTTTKKTTPTTPTTTTKRTTPTTTTKKTTPTTTSTTEIPECPHGEFKEHHDCTRFWLCVSGHWREQSCPNNQYFDKYKNYCVPEDGSCRPTTPTTTTEKTTPTTPTTTTKRTTPTTTTKRTTPTTTSTTETPECPHGEFKEHHDCTRFWLCVSGHWREQSCPNNQYFDKYKNYCVPEDGSCRPTTPTTTTEKTTPTTPTTTTKRTTPTTTTKRTTPTTTSTTEIPECPHGEFKEHHDCTRFWLCVSGHWREQSCPNNQYFDKYKNYCVPEDGTCRPTTPTTTTEKTTPTTPTTTTKRTTPTTTTKRTTPTATSTTEIPECPHGEFKEHHDCTRFWLCVSGHWREQSCPNNQYFDKYKNYCVPEDGSCRSTTPTTTTKKTRPTTTTRTTSSTPTTSVTTPIPQCRHGEYRENPNDCTKFVLCVVGIWRAQTCSDGQYFNPKLNYCVPEDGSCRPTKPTVTTTVTTPRPKCVHGEYREYLDDCTKFEICVLGIWRTQVCSSNQYFNPKLNYCVPEDGSCRPTKPTIQTTSSTPSCRHGEYKENHNDCTAFYLCVVGVWRNQYCSNNQYFNPKLNYCVPEDGSCRPTKPTVTTTVTTPRPKCVHGEYREYPEDCTKFEICVLGIWRTQVCSNNQYFNTKLNYCVPEDGSCRPTKPTVTTTITTPKPKCIHGQYKENPNDCTKFYLCVSGEWRDQNCSNNQYFNKALNYCVPEDGSCRPTPKPKCIHGEYKEDPSDCTKFYLCVSGEWRDQNCSNNQYFNKALNYCVPEDGSCRPTPKPKCIHGQYKENPSDCTKFYLCVSGEWRDQNCSNNQYFNKALNYCVPEDGSCRPTPKPKCIHGEYKEDPSDCTKFYLCVSGEWRNQLCPNDNYFNKSYNYCIPEDGTCNPTKSCIHGEYRDDPKNCFNFYLCVNGIWREQKCQGGQYFNKNLNICVSNDGSCKSSIKK